MAFLDVVIAARQSEAENQRVDSGSRELACVFVIKNKSNGDEARLASQSERLNFPRCVVAVRGECRVKCAINLSERRPVRDALHAQFFQARKNAFE